MAAAQRVLYGRSDATRFAAEEFLPRSVKPSGNCCRRIRELNAPLRRACFPTMWRCRSP
jgi:hypothetical protein